jgi:CubicO group peptidase (beta-lactamase class C family)
MAVGYGWRDSNYSAVPFQDLTEISGAGSVISNVLDYTKWLKVLLNSSPPLSPAGHAAIKTPRIFVPSSYEPSPFSGPFAYTLGWDFGVYKGYEFFTHTGGMEAFGTFVVFFPELKFGTVTFGNTAIASYAGWSLSWHLLDEKLGVPEKERFDWDAKYVFFYLSLFTLLPSFWPNTH